MISVRISSQDLDHLIYLFIYLFIGLFNRDHAYSWTLLYKNTPCKYARISNNNYFSSAVPRQVTNIKTANNNTTFIHYK